MIGKDLISEMYIQHTHTHTENVEFLIGAARPYAMRVV